MAWRDRWAKMTPMQSSSPSNPSASPRRFILLPEESVDGHGQRPRIRRYRLTSVGRRPDLNGVDVATARIARESGRLSRV
jgi:hypothetical protein